MISSEPVDQYAADSRCELGEITLYEGLTLHKVDRTEPGPARGTQVLAGDNKKVVLDASKAKLTFSSGTIPPPTRALDRSVLFVTSVSVVDWDTGETSSPVGITVQTRMFQAL